MNITTKNDLYCNNEAGAVSSVENMWVNYQHKMKGEGHKELIIFSFEGHIAFFSTYDLLINVQLKCKVICTLEYKISIMNFDLVRTENTWV